jgi:hypothetical protein
LFLVSNTPKLLLNESFSSNEALAALLSMVFGQRKPGRWFGRAVRFGGNFPNEVTHVFP